jgi:hypothetical protein
MKKVLLAGMAVLALGSVAHAFTGLDTQNCMPLAEKRRIANLPANRILRAYTAYIYSKVCHDVREGYVVQFVNDIELGWAEKAVSAVVEQATAQDTSIDTDVQWQNALREANRWPTNFDLCRIRLGELMAMSPEPVYTVTKPQ